MLVQAGPAVQYVDKSFLISSLDLAPCQETQVTLALTQFDSDLLRRQAQAHEKRRDDLD